MISIKCIETKTFMNNIFKGIIFNEWEGRQIEIDTYTKFKIDCKINKDFYTTEEYQCLIHKQYATWEKLRNSIVNLIKGNKPPTTMKIVLSYPLNLLENLDITNIDGLYININFNNNVVMITTGTALKTFTLDKSIDHYWDNFIHDYLNIIFSRIAISYIM